MEKTRYFTNVRGFSDGTKYIEVRPYSSILHGYYGTKGSDNWNLTECLRAVDDGNFKEIPDPNIKKPAPKPKRRWRKVDPENVKLIFRSDVNGYKCRVSIKDARNLYDYNKIIGVEILS